MTNSTPQTDEDVVAKARAILEGRPYISRIRLARLCRTSVRRLERLGVAPPPMTASAAGRVGRYAMEAKNPQWVARWNAFAKGQ